MEEVLGTIDHAGRQALDYLASPAGLRLRRALAAGIVVGAPVIFRLPVLRRHPVIRFLDLIGGTAALIALARVIREWEPEGSTVTVETDPDAPYRQRAASGPNGHRTG
jgi:hypothetical protein